MAIYDAHGQAALAASVFVALPLAVAPILPLPEPPTASDSLLTLRTFVTRIELRDVEKVPIA